MDTGIQLTRKQQIRHTACELFRARGYVGASMRDLAKEVGIEPGSLYSHIPSKEALLQEICFDLATKFVEAQNGLSSGMNPAEQFAELLKRHLAIVVADPASAAVFFHEWRHLSDDQLQKFRQMRQAYEQVFLDLFLACVQSGLFRNLEPRQTCNLIFSALNATHEWYRPGPTNPLKPDQIIDIIMNGITIKQ